VSDEQGPVAGWYPDVEVPGGERYWDGGAWTDHRRPGPGVPTWNAPQGGAPSWGAAQGGSPWGAPPGGAPSWSAPAQPIDTWLWQSIVATILCCQPLGIVGIVMSAQAGAARDAGNYALAQRRADQARTWTLAAVGAFFVIFLGFFLLGGLAALGGW
jgi:hypothetical protein